MNTKFLSFRYVGGFDDRSLSSQRTINILLKCIGNTVSFRFKIKQLTKADYDPLALQKYETSRTLSRT